MSGWWRAPKTPTVASRAGLEPARRSNSRILTVVTSCRLSGVMAMHVPRAKHAPARSRPCLGGHALSTRPGAAAVKVRRWARHSVMCWSHATEGSQTRHVAGSRSQQRLLRASASFTDASRSSCRWPRPQWHWVRRDVGHMVWRRAHAVDALRRASRRPHVRAEGAAGDGRGAGRGPPVGPQLRATPRRGRGRRCRKFLDRGGEMSEHPVYVRSGLSRGLLGYEGNSCRPHRHPAPVRRAHRAPDRAFRGGRACPGAP